MKRLIALVCMCGVAALAGCANSNKSGMGDGSGQPDMKAMEAAMMAAGKPGDMHAILTSKAGTWEGKSKCWMDPSQPPTESTCSTTIMSFMDGRFTKSETHGSMPGFDGKPMTFEGFGVYGYNNETKQFESTWLDNMGTMQMYLTGKLSPDRKTMTWNSTYICPMTHKKTWMRLVERYTSADTMTMEMYGPNCMTGEGDQKMMEIQYARTGRKSW